MTPYRRNPANSRVAQRLAAVNAHYARLEADRRSGLRWSRIGTMIVLLVVAAGTLWSLF